MIPSHISILHVEQEVEGDNTIALESVLECDEEREKLLREEKAISLQLSSRCGYFTSINQWMCVLSKEQWNTATENYQGQTNFICYKHYLNETDYAVN